MTEPDGERLKSLEVQMEAHAKALQRLVDFELTMARWVAAQEERNAIAREMQHDRHEDRWQVWVRWLFNPGLPLGAFALVVWQVMTGGNTP